jgi:predicted nucleotidyltransferase
VNHSQCALKEKVMEKVTQKTISAFARRIAKQFNPQKIILFGSYAYGKPTQDSDVDMLVIMSFEGRGAYKSAEIATALRPEFPADILVRTPEQIKQRLEWGDFFIREITEKGKVLYEA